MSNTVTGGSLMGPEDLEALVHSAHPDPFAVLGRHSVTLNGQKVALIRAFLTEAQQAWVVDLSQGHAGRRVEMKRVHADGLFEAVLPGLPLDFPYRLAVQSAEGHSWEFEDPYRFEPVLTEFDLHLLGEGTHLRNYEKLGAHVMTHQGIKGVHFAVWAPNALRVGVIGNFNHWDGRRHPMRSCGPTGIWELFVPDLAPGEVYKFEVKSRFQAVQVRSLRALR